LLPGEFGEIGSRVPEADSGYRQYASEESNHNSGNGSNKFIGMVDRHFSDEATDGIYMLLYLVCGLLYPIGFVCHYWGSKRQNIQEHHFLGRLSRLAGISILFAWPVATAIVVVIALDSLP
jgi:hypothetical protein